jgi:hypothetical protein
MLVMPNVGLITHWKFSTTDTKWSELWYMAYNRGDHSTEGIGFGYENAGHAVHGRYPEVDRSTRRVGIDSPGQTLQEEPYDKKGSARTRCSIQPTGTECSTT